MKILTRGWSKDRRPPAAFVRKMLRHLIARAEFDGAEAMGASLCAGDHSLAWVPFFRCPVCKAQV